jgi:hypothetical protein
VLLYTVCTLLVPDPPTSFIPCYPTVKATVKQFRKQVYEIFINIKKEHGIPAFVMFRKSDIEDLRGQR